MIKHVLKYAFAGILIFSSCNSEDFELGKNLVSSPITSAIIDTVTIKVSSLVAADSVTTVGRGIGYMGAYTDPHTGTVKAKSYIEFNRTFDAESDRAAVFDSVTLILRPNGNYFGDTTIHAFFRISRIMKPIEREDDGNLYSSTKIPDDWLDELVPPDIPFKIGVKDIVNNEIEIKLPRHLGEELFLGIVRDEEDYRAINFRNTFSGLAIEAGADSDCVFGFFVNDTACMVRIYYHVSSTSRQERTMTFSANQFNSFYSMTHDMAKLTDIPAPFDTKSAPAPTSLTDNMGIVTAGNSPIFARLEFPYLNELLLLGQIVKIQSAILYIRPVHRSFDTIPLPPRLNLFQFDPTSNSPIGSALTTGGSNPGAQFGNLPENYHRIESPNFPQYRFDVTGFISNQLGRTGHEKWALSLLVPNDTRENTIQRLVFGDQNFWFRSENQSRENRIKIEIKYTIYND